MPPQLNKGYNKKLGRTLSSKTPSYRPEDLEKKAKDAELHYDAVNKRSNNFFAWHKKLEETIGASFKKHCSSLFHGGDPVYYEIDEDDYAYPPGATNLEKKRIERDRDNMSKCYISWNKEASEDREKIFSMILESLSEESKRVVQGHDRYDTEADVKANGVSDPVVLLEIIQATHLGYVGTNRDHPILARYGFIAGSMKIFYNKEHETLENFAERLYNHFKSMEYYANSNPLPQPLPGDPDNMEVVPILEESWYAEIFVEQTKVVHAEAIANYRNQVNADTRDIFKTIKEALSFIRAFVPSTPIAKKNAYKVASRKAGKFDNKRKGQDKKAGDGAGAGKIKSIKELRKGSGARLDKATGRMKYPDKCKKCQSLKVKGDWNHWWDECPNNNKRKDREESDDVVEDEEEESDQTKAAVAFLLKGNKKIKK